MVCSENVCNSADIIIINYSGKISLCKYVNFLEVKQEFKHMLIVKSLSLKSVIEGLRNVMLFL